MGCDRRDAGTPGRFAPPTSGRWSRPRLAGFMQPDGHNSLVVQVGVAATLFGAPILAAGPRRAPLALGILFGVDPPFDAASRFDLGLKLRA
jgi:hypothetical protein